MSELRQNMATKEWVIIATERARRPREFVATGKRPLADLPVHDATCPFCPGNEEASLESLRIPEVGAWQIRMVRNRYPALQVEGERQRTFDGVHRQINGVGYHEILVETPVHNTCFALEPPANVALALQALQMRGTMIAQDPRVDHIIYFKNHGPLAGTSLVHPHVQLMAVPVVPLSIRNRIEEARRHFDNVGECVYCAMLADEQADGARLVAVTDHFVAFVPFAAGTPFHTWIVPRRHESSFLRATAAEIADLGRMVGTVLRRLYVGLNDPDYNWIIRSEPIRDSAVDYFHWYLTIVPRVAQPAGFELGSGMFINAALPEESASFLREVRLADHG